MALNVRREGYMLKQGVINSKLKMRWFLLTDDSLIYFADATNAAQLKSFTSIHFIERGISHLAKGVILLKNAKIVPSNLKSELSERSFAIKINNRTYQLVCDTSEEVKYWKSSIERVLASISTLAPRTSAITPELMNRLRSLEDKEEDVDSTGIKEENLGRHTSFCEMKTNEDPMNDEGDAGEDQFVDVIAPTLSELSLNYMVNIELSSFIEMWREGITLNKHGRKGKPHRRVLHLDCSTGVNINNHLPTFYIFFLTIGVLTWGRIDNDKKRFLNIFDCILSIGKNTDAFARAKVPAELCFSLVYMDRSLNLECESKEQRDKIVKGIKDMQNMYYHLYQKKTGSSWKDRSPHSIFRQRARDEEQAKLLAVNSLLGQLGTTHKLPTPTPLVTIDPHRNTKPLKEKEIKLKGICITSMGFTGCDCMTIIKEEKIAFSTAEKDIELWDASRLNEQKSSCLGFFKGHSKRIRHLSYIPETNQLVSGSDDKTCRIWNLDTFKCEKTFLKGPAGVLSAVAVPSHGLLYATYFHNEIKAWSLNTQQLKNSIKGHTDHVTRIRTIKNNTHLLSCSLDGYLRLWDSATGDALRSAAAGDRIFDILELDTNLHAAAAGKVIEIWDILSGHRIHLLTGHTDCISSLAYLDERQFISASADSTLRLWDARTTKCLRILKGHEGVVECVATLPSTPLIISGSFDQSEPLKVWQ